MTKILWDTAGEKYYESGVDHGVLYLNNAGKYENGVAWNGLTTVTESPEGAEAEKQYADNIVYANLVSAEEFKATIEAFTYPDKFLEVDGGAELSSGVIISQQARKTFGLTYRTKKGNDTEGMNAGYKLHLLYGLLAAPSEKEYATINDSPEAITFSWEVSSTPVAVKDHNPTSVLTIDSITADPEKLKKLEDILYGSDSEEPRLPLPDEVAALFANA